MMVWVFTISSVLRSQVSNDKTKAHWTYIEDLKEPAQVRFPCRNHVSVILRVKESREPVPLASFDNLLLYFCNGPTVTSTINGRGGDVCCWLNLRCKLIYSVAHRLAEIAQFPVAHSTFKSFAYISAGQPEIDVILFVGHRVLTVREHGTSNHGKERSSPESW